MSATWLPVIESRAGVVLCQAMALWQIRAELAVGGSHEVVLD